MFCLQYFGTLVQYFGFLISDLHSWFCTSNIREFEQRLKYENEDVLDNFCPSAHYRAHTESEVAVLCGTRQELGTLTHECITCLHGTTIADPKHSIRKIMQADGQKLSSASSLS